MAHTSVGVQDLRRGTENTLTLCDKAASEIADLDRVHPLSGETRKVFDRALALLDRARDRLEDSQAPDRIVWANKTAARCLEQLLDVRRRLKLKGDLMHPLEYPEDTCFYCARDDHPPFVQVSLGELSMNVCTSCQRNIRPYEPLISNEIPVVRASNRRAFLARGPSWTLPAGIAGIIVIVVLVLFGFRSGGPFAAAVQPTVTPTAAPTVTPIPDTPTSTPEPSTPTPSPQSTETSTPPTNTMGTNGTALYKADFSHGTPGWIRNGDEKWTTVDGVLTADGSGDGSLFAPFTSKGIANFAVEASMQAVKDDAYGYGYFAIDVHDSGQNDGSGVASGFQDENSSLDIWPLDNSNNLNTSNYTLDRHWHLYRLEVRGNSYNLSVDGIPMVSATSNHSLSENLLGIHAKYEVSIRSFRVLPLH